MWYNAKVPLSYRFCWLSILTARHTLPPKIICQSNSGNYIYLFIYISHMLLCRCVPWWHGWCLVMTGPVIPFAKFCTVFGIFHSYGRIVFVIKFDMTKLPNIKFPEMQVGFFYRVLNTFVVARNSFFHNPNTFCWLILTRATHFRSPFLCGQKNLLVNHLLLPFAERAANYNGWIVLYVWLGKL